MFKQWRKALATVIGVVIVAAGPKLGFTQDQCAMIVGVIGAFIVGQGLADFKKNAPKL